MFRTVERFEETGLGLPYSVVLLHSAEEEVDDVTGEVVGISVPDMENLVVSVALTRALDPMQLCGEEVRFIRQAIGMSATAFADALTLDKATFSRWENGKQELGEWADKQVRQIAVIELVRKVPCLSIDPKNIVRLRTRKPQKGEYPHIEMRRVQIGSGEPCAGEEAWDMLPLAA